MDLKSILVMNLYSILLLVVICFHSLKDDEKPSLQNKLYRMIVLTTIVMLIVDIFSRLDGKPGTVYSSLNHIGNFMVFTFNPIIPSIWLLYVFCFVHSEEDKTLRLLYPIMAANAIQAILVVLSQPYGWFYSIDSNNIYHRGPLYLLSASIPVTLLLMAYIFIIVNQKKIDKKQYYSLLLFPVPPLVSIVLQIVYYGVSLILNSIVISLLIVYLNVQSHSLYTDYLTNVYNRKKLEVFLKSKIRTSTNEKSFSAIMIDLDDFKSINDTFGHDIGDDALQTAAKLLRSCLNSNDFIARLGGDEFFIILDSSSTKDLKNVIRRIHNSIETYNGSSNQPYRLGLSMGYSVYDKNSGMNAEDFIRFVDGLMYHNKRTHSFRHKDANK